jgi:hypothetical protein
MDADEQYCVNCANCKRTYPIFINLIPIVGQIIFAAGYGFSPVNHWCKKSGSISEVTGKYTYTQTCKNVRDRLGSTCPNFLSVSTPLKNTPDRWLMDEIRTRGLLKTMQNYKKSGDV